MIHRPDKKGGTDTPAKAALVVEDLHVSVDGNEILKGVDLVIYPGEIHALMGPNGSGKSTLSNALMGHPNYRITQGKVLLMGDDLMELSPEERAERGLFVAFQDATPVPGVTLANFLRTALNSVSGEVWAVARFRDLLLEKMKLLKLDEFFSTRDVNEGFSGGEKKLAEILQMAILQPRMAILDETDSGLDIDAMKTVADVIKSMTGPDRSILLITHYRRILGYIPPDRVHVMAGGRIVRSAGPELAGEVEAKGYDVILSELSAANNPS